MNYSFKRKGTMGSVGDNAEHLKNSGKEEMFLNCDEKKKSHITKDG